MKYGKSRIDRAGKIVSSCFPEHDCDEIVYLEAEELLDEYRKTHLEPLATLTVNLQNYLEYEPFYIAYRLKRKPQIIKKLKRFTVRLTQLQDIAGVRIIVDDNKKVNIIRDSILNYIHHNHDIIKVKENDYREAGRHDTGYRALHIIVKYKNKYIEIQLRSKVQHAWAEIVERLSISYGYALKEAEGDPIVIQYLKELSRLLYAVDMGRKVVPEDKLYLQQLKDSADKILKQSDNYKKYASIHSTGILRIMAEQEKSKKTDINNWIIVYDWNNGVFVDWRHISVPKPEVMIDQYTDMESQYPADTGYEVVLIGASSVSVIQQTHSHYFGIGAVDDLRILDPSLALPTSEHNLPNEQLMILAVLRKKKYWGKHAVKIDTLKNHYIPDVHMLEAHIEELVRKGYLIKPRRGVITLNIRNRKYIEDILPS
ncbi:RelA/SpoT domain-containing protein [Oceanithermus sp.]|uniref:RelA/SpoT domain-containing protein n=1 Tax=Oceanithermus sp. TaxID=2268145 RepID=UPI0025CBCA4E|nr:RelA/SpoT domain-containing protein [Oceanithermus sp.]